jgi:hypothetical protein
MSYDIYLQYDVCDKCGQGQEIDVRYDSPTYNYGAMIREADKLAGGDGCSFGAIHNRPGKETAKWFSMILKQLYENEDKIKPLEPDNGWGTFETLKEIFQYYRNMSEEHPNAIWTQSGSGDEDLKCCAGWECIENET